MVSSLGKGLALTKCPFGVNGSVPDHFEERFPADVMRACKRDKYSSGIEHLERSEVNFLVAAKSVFLCSLVSGKGWRVEYNQVKFLCA